MIYFTLLEAAKKLTTAAEVARDDDGEIALIIRRPHGHNITREELFRTKTAEGTVSLYIHRRNNEGELIIKLVLKYNLLIKKVLKLKIINPV